MTGLLSARNIATPPGDWYRRYLVILHSVSTAVPAVAEDQRSRVDLGVSARRAGRSDGTGIRKCVEDRMRRAQVGAAIEPRHECGLYDGALQ